MMPIDYLSALVFSFSTTVAFAVLLQAPRAKPCPLAALLVPWAGLFSSMCARKWARAAFMLIFVLRLFCRY